MPPSAPRRGKKPFQQSPQDNHMIEVTESILRRVFPKVFAACPWADPDEVHECLLKTFPQFDEIEAIAILKSNNRALLSGEEEEEEEEQKKPSAEILSAYELPPEGPSPEKGKGAPLRKPSGPGGKPVSKRASPVPDPHTVQQVAKRPRKQGFHRDTPIEILDEEDAISSSSQHLPLPPSPGHSRKQDAAAVQVERSVDSITDPEFMDIDSPPTRPKLSTNHSPGTSLSLRQTHRPLQSHITEYMNSPISSQRPQQPPSIANAKTKDTGWGHHRASTPYSVHVKPPSSNSSDCSPSPQKPAQGIAGPIPTTIGEAKAFQALPDPKKVRKKLDSRLLDDSDHNVNSSPLPHKKNTQRKPAVEIPSNSSSSTRLGEKSKRNTTSSVEIVSDDDHKMQVTSTKSKLQMNDQPKKVQADRNKMPPSPSIQLIQSCQSQSTEGKEKKKLQLSPMFQRISPAREIEEFATLSELFNVNDSKITKKPPSLNTRIEIPSSQPSPPSIVADLDSGWNIIPQEKVVQVKHSTCRTTITSTTLTTLERRLTDTSGSSLVLTAPSPTRATRGGSGPSSNSHEVEYVPDSDEEPKKFRPYQGKKSHKGGKKSTVYGKQKTGKNREFVEAAVDEEGGERDQVDEGEGLDDEEQEDEVGLEFKAVNPFFKNRDEWKSGGSGDRRKRLTRK